MAHVNWCSMKAWKWKFASDEIAHWISLIRYPLNYTGNTAAFVLFGCCHFILVFIDGNLAWDGLFILPITK